MSTYQDERFPVPTPRRLARELRLVRPPWWMVAILGVLIVGALIPLVMILAVRGRQSADGKIHFVMDMDNQPRFGPQSPHPSFTDGRSMRAPVSGTVARGQLRDDDHMYRGYREDRDGDIVRVEFFNELPPELVSPTLVERGRERYTIYCALCHGERGRGNGKINQRAIELKETQWVPATDLMSTQVRELRDGQIYRTIGEGVRNMPPYRSQIRVEDRWAIVAYLRQMQSVEPVETESTNQQDATATDAVN